MSSGLGVLVGGIGIIVGIGLLVHVDCLVWMAEGVGVNVGVGKGEAFTGRVSNGIGEDIGVNVLGIVVEVADGRSSTTVSLVTI